MKNLLLLTALFLCSVVSYAKTYYVSPTGSDSNPGTLALPFKNWEKLSNLMVAGDIAYIRGGTYYSPYTASKTTHCAIQNLTGTAANPIIIQNYPGEYPVFDFSNLGIPTTSDPTAVLINYCTYLRIKGLRITGLQQNRSGSGISRGFELWNSPNCTMELMEVDHIGGSGFMVQEASNDAYFLNCDSHNNDDRWSTNSAAWGGADGFDVTGNVSSTRTTFDGCRAWLNSDDGWDNYNTDGIRTWKNCWAFWNGYYKDAGMTTMLPAGNGEGFKLGPTHSDMTSTTLRFLQNCVAFENRDNGFDQNGTPTTLYQLYNCTSYKNGSIGFQFQYYPSTAINHVFKNNVAYANAVQDLRYTGANTNNIRNTWNGLVSTTAADFQSVSSTGADGARQSDGSLPNLTFLKLATGSDLVNAGINIGLPFLSSAPDMGAFESTGAAPANVAPTANAGADQVISLPVSSASLTGAGTDPDGSISAYTWTKVSGPASGTITSPSAAATTITGLTQGVYTYTLKVTDNLGATATDSIKLTVNAATSNKAPVANAGTDQVITLPVSTVTLTGTGTDSDGTIAGYKWTKVSGPTAGTITTATTATTTVTGLVQGVYKWELTVTDNLGATGKDTVITTVNATTTTTTGLKIIRVNIYGTAVYGNANWNNWKPTATVYSGNFKYENGATSTVTAVLSRQNKIQDNGSAYLSTATICPPAVLRFASANSGSRTFTMRGLSTTKQYSFELYASSSTTGNNTRFSIGSTSYTITTGNNKTAVAKFVNITPNALGMVTITIASTATWNYLNGFVITEQAGILAKELTDTVGTQTQADANISVNIFPLPFSTSFTVNLYSETNGLYELNLVDLFGKSVLKRQVNKTTAAANETIYMGNLRPGSYILQVTSPDQKKTAYPVIKH